MWFDAEWGTDVARALSHGHVARGRLFVVKN
jgi:hypothetical protein